MPAVPLVLPSFFFILPRYKYLTSREGKFQYGTRTVVTAVTENEIRQSQLSC